MREWGSDPGEQPDKWLRLEAIVIGACISAVYTMALYLVIA